MTRSQWVAPYVLAAGLALFLALPCSAAVTNAAEKAAAAEPNLNADFARCRAGAIDACYDAIRWRPSDPSLLSGLGDAQLRANRPADALRTFQRVATLAPNLPGIGAKISAIETKLAAKRTPKATHGAAADAKRYSNAAPETQSH